MKNLILTLLLSMSSIAVVQAQDVYICETVLFCLDSGKCFELEICDIVEPFYLTDLKNPFKGSFDQKFSSLTISGFSKRAEGRTVIIQKNTQLKIPEGIKATSEWSVPSIVPGKYNIKAGRLTLKLGEKG